MDKLYYKTITEGDTGISRDDFGIRIEADRENRTLRIIDNGMGMTREELEKNLGTIAKSGSLDFKSEMDKKDEIDIIGQFGVGSVSYTHLDVYKRQIHERVENAKLQALHEVKINEIYRSVYIPGGIVCGPCYICKLHHIDLEFIKARVYNFKCIEKN